MWRGIFPGATKIASNRQSLIVSSGFAASQTSAAAAIRRRCRGLTDSAAASRFDLAFTSTNTNSRRRRATMSISPSGLRQRRARMRKPLAIRKAAARLSAEIPTRNAACRSGRADALQRRVAARHLTSFSRIPGEDQCTLVDLTARTPGGERDFADRVLDRNTPQRLAQ